MPSSPSEPPAKAIASLADHPGLPVLIVDDAAYKARLQALNPPYGLLALDSLAQTDHTMWTPLYGRRVLLWPTSQASYELMEALGGMLAARCLEVKLLEPGPGPLESFEAFVAWAKPRAHIVSIPSAPEDATPPPDKSTLAIWQQLGLACTSNGNPICNADNVLRVLERAEQPPDIWHDTFHQRIFTVDAHGTPRPWVDADTIRMTLRLQRELGLSRMNTGAVLDAITDYALGRARHEPRDWCDTLAWDGTKRIMYTFIKYFGSPETPYTQAVGRNFWVGLAARIYQPGCKVDNMVILEGSQGIRKSSALMIIGGSWYARSSTSVMSKDFYLTMMGRLLMEIADLDAFVRAEVTTIKRIIDCQVDRYRNPYGRLAEDHPRTCLLVGTTNEEQYLRDFTGGRRFWPIRCYKIDVDLLCSDREQLFAEAVALFKDGITWHEMPASTEDEQEQRRHADSWEEPIAEFMLSRVETTTKEVLTDCLHFELARIGRADEMRVAQVLRRFGYVSKMARDLIDGIRVTRRWVRVDHVEQEEQGEGE